MDKAKVIEFKNPKDSKDSGETMVEENFEELIDVVVRLRTHVLGYHDLKEFKKPHAGSCTEETACTEVCEQISVLNLSNSLLNRLDVALRKFDLLP